FRELVFDPLGLTKTYLYTDVTDRRPKTLHFKNKPLLIPRGMASFGPDGGAVSTSQEMLIFIEAFFKGFFFPENYVDELQTWNRIFFPMQSGVGIHRFKLPWIFNPFGTFPDLIGHSGLSGSLAYYSPARNLYITGTVNQVAFPDTSFRLAIKLIQQAMKE
ncbi:MAG TPA: serine hydrolase domain-containing protein, partial [Chryseosolibacter sp.]